jgi:hypothetical protein
MLIIATATLMALGLAYLIMTKGHKSDTARLAEPRPAIPTMGVQIICGDCAGDQIIPQKTYLDHNGNCERCGGHSYLLASNLALYALQTRLSRLADAQNLSASGRVIPFDAASRARSEKIAV